MDAAVGCVGGGGGLPTSAGTATGTAAGARAGAAGGSVGGSGSSDSGGDGCGCSVLAADSATTVADDGAVARRLGVSETASPPSGTGDTGAYIRWTVA